MEQTWRWFGEDDPVTLENVVQAGATGIVSALHDVPAGELWTIPAIERHKALINAHGLEWSVVESVPVSNEIKLRDGDYIRHLKNYTQTLRNLGACGVHRVCYNFMPVIDWTRTNLSYELPNRSHALRFEMAHFALYDVFVLQREAAEKDYPEAVLNHARRLLNDFDVSAIDALEQNIIAGLPGGEGSYNREGLRRALEAFSSLGTSRYRQNFFEFLQQVIPIAQEANVLMAVHPDDPPFPLFGLPRVVSTASDARALLEAVPSPSNGLTMCAGSFGARSDNDLVGMIHEFGSNIHFAHLRNIVREADGSFTESEHLEGDNDIVGIVSALLDEEAQRKARGTQFCEIPIRPDHGHAMGDEKNASETRPGYSFAGRMKGLAELRGVIHTLNRVRSTGI